MMTGSLSGPLARIKVGGKNCSGMIEWQAVREAAARFLSTQQQQHGNIETCLVLNKKGSRQCPKIEVQNKETLMDLWSAACLWEWWRQERGGA